MFDSLDEGELTDLAVQQAMFLGLLALGIAAGAGIGLMQLQQACIAVGALPEPGTELTGNAILSESPCWQSAKLLQSIANYAGYAAAALLLGGAVLDQYPDRLREVVSG